MMNAFILDFGGQRSFFACPCCENKILNNSISSDNKIPVFYSYSEAIQHGWRFMRDIKFCPPEFVDEGVWVCPECMKSCLE